VPWPRKTRIQPFIREHIVADETYRLGEDDVAFGLRPETPGSMQQAEFEDETRSPSNASPSSSIADSFTLARSADLMTTR
jgi:hypothetical protein